MNFDKETTVAQISEKRPNSAVLNEKDIVRCACGSETFNLRHKTFKNGTKHVAAICSHCATHKQLLPQHSNMDSELVQDRPVFLMPFGRHKGQSMEILPQDYLKWGVENLDGRNIKDRMKAELTRRGIKCTNTTE